MYLKLGALIRFSQALKVMAGQKKKGFKSNHRVTKVTEIVVNTKTVTVTLCRSHMIVSVTKGHGDCVQHNECDSDIEDYIIDCFKTKDQCEIGDSDCGEHNDSDSEIDIKPSQLI
jgi:hypothetical protein